MVIVLLVVIRRLERPVAAAGGDNNDALDDDDGNDEEEAAATCRCARLGLTLDLGDDALPCKPNKPASVLSFELLFCFWPVLKWRLQRERGKLGQVVQQTKREHAESVSACAWLCF